MTDLPNLIGWGRGGVPGELSSFLNSLDTSTRMDRGEDVSGVRDLGYAEEGVARVAMELLDRLRSERERWPKLSYEIATWCYLLHAYCAEWKRPPPPMLLWLTFEALGLKECVPDRAVQKKLGIPVGIVKIAAFLDAGALDGEADAKGVTLKVSDLARRVGVERATVRRWRESKTYQRRRDFVAYSHRSR